MVPVKRYVDRQNGIIEDALSKEDIDKIKLAKELNVDIDDKGFESEEKDLEKRIQGIIVDRINYLITYSNINNQNFAYFKSKINAMVESEVELYLSKISENSKELYEVVKRKIRSATDMVVHSVMSFVEGRGFN